MAGYSGVDVVRVLALVFFLSMTNAKNVCDPDQIVSKGDKIMPVIPKSYEMGVLVDSSEANTTSELLMGTDGFLAYAKITFNITQVTYIGDYKRDQMLTLTHAVEDSNLVECDVAKLKDAANNGQWLFGYNDTLGPHPDDPGWIFQFKAFNEIYTSTETKMGIPCNRWEACKEIKMRGSGNKETVGMKFYWSDPEKWTPVAGSNEEGKPYSVPVLIEITRIDKGKLVVQQLYVFRYLSVGPPVEAFEIPQGVFCNGLLGENVTIPTVPKYFSYDSEIILQHGFTGALLYQKHYFDDEFKLTRMEFSPVQNGQTVPTIGDKPNTVGEMSLIYDLNSGYSYLIDKDRRECTVSAIEVKDVAIDPSVPQEIMRMTNFMNFLKNKEIQYTYYEQKMERGIAAKVFMGLMESKNENKSATIYEFWFSSALEEIQGEDSWTSNKPLKFSVYPVIDPATPYVTVNIFNFDADRPDVLEYDISTCSPIDEHMQLHLSLDGRYDIPEMPNVVNFTHQILSSLLTFMDVSPLRIHNIQLGTEPDVTLVSFTLLSLAKDDNGRLVQSEKEKTSNEAVATLRNAIDAGIFRVGLGSATTEWLTAIKESLYVEDMGVPTTACTGFSPAASPSQKQMPKWDLVYEAGVLVNRIQNKSSHEMYFGVEGDKAVVKRVFDGIELTLIGDYTRKQLIEMTGDLGDPRPRFCITKSLDEAAKKGQWVFGYNTTGEHSHPHPDDPGWVFHFDDFQEVYMGKSEILGIPCDKWEACTPIKFSDGHEEFVGAKFYWSDAETWSPPIGNKKSVPVKIEMSRSVNNKLDVVEYVFLMYSNLGPPDEILQIPQGVYCNGITGTDALLPTVPDYFSFDSEIIFIKGLEHLIFYQKHYFDDKLKLSRMDFSPLPNDERIPIGDRRNNSVGQFTQIHDFTAGLSYLIETNSGVCLPPAPIDEMDEDVQNVAKSKVRMRNPMAFLKMTDIKYTYYQEKNLRDIPANMFIGLQKGKLDMIYEYWFSAPLDEIEGSGMWTTKKPLKFSIYPQADPDNAMASVHTNIFNFDIDEPDIVIYDISACTPPDLRKDITFQLSEPYNDILMPSMVQFKRQIRDALVKNMMVSPLRIHNIELKTEDQVTTVIFTLLMKPTQKGDGVDTEFKELSSDDALDMLKKQINEGSLIVGIPDPDLPLVTAAKDSLKTLENRTTTYTSSNQNTSKGSSGYNGGDMAGLAVGMLALGVLVTLLAGYVFYRRPFKWPRDFEHKVFVNDQHEPQVMDSNAG